MVPDTPPTAEGDLAQTPFAHLAVYAMDRRLTGELFLTDPDGVTHAIRFEGGMPVKIRTGGDYARLGDLLVDAGLCPRETVEGAAMAGGLLGDMLVLAGYVESAALNDVLDQQFRARMSMFYELPPETQYRYFDGSQTLKEWGGDPHSVDPMSLVWQGIRTHAEKSSQFDATLEKLGTAPLRLHPKAPVSRLGLEVDAAAVVSLIELDPTPLDELCTLGEASPELTRRVIYALLLLRQLDLGRPGLPVGVQERPASVAKVRLKSKMHRVGAALDHPGVGERSVRLTGRGIVPRDDDGMVPIPPPSESGPGLSMADPTSTDGSIEVGEGELTEDELLDELEAESGVKEVDPAVRREARAQIEGAVASAADASAGGASEAKPAAAEKTAEPTPAPAKAAEVEDEAMASGRRLLAELSSTPLVDLVALARAKMDEKDHSGAASVCEIARKRLETETPDPAVGDKLVALYAWSRASLPHPDLKALTIGLDDLIRERDLDPLPRFVRGLLRKRLGDGPGSQADFRRVLELEPGHALAKKEVSEPAEEKPARRGETGFLKRLFRK
jgi:hypothetical protein